MAKPMFVTRHHAKHMLTYVNLTAAQIIAYAREKCDEVIKHSAPFINIRKIPKEVLKTDGFHHSLTFARSRGKC